MEFLNKAEKVKVNRAFNCAFPQSCKRLFHASIKACGKQHLALAELLPHIPASTGITTSAVQQHGTVNSRLHLQAKPKSLLNLLHLRAQVLFSLSGMELEEHSESQWQ